MLSPSPISRRSMLKASGTGVLVLSLPLAAGETASAAPAPPLKHAALRRTAWTPLIGTELPVADGPTLRLVSVDDLARSGDDASLRGHDEAFVLGLIGPAAPPLRSAIHELMHPSLGSVWLFVTPVGAVDGADAQRYEIIIDRTVRIPAELDVLVDDAPADAVQAPAGPAAVAPAVRPAPAVRAAAPLVSGAPATPHRRVRARAVRRHGALTLELRFPGGGLQAVSVELRRKGKVVGRGGDAVRTGRARLKVRSRHPLRRGTYALHLTVTDRSGRPTQLIRHLTVR